MKTHLGATPVFRQSGFLALFFLTGMLLLSSSASAAFTPGATLLAGATPSSGVPADVDGDGDEDMVVVNYSVDTLSILLNNGNGVFSAPVSYGTGDGPYSVVAVDVDGDSDLDLATPNSLSDNISILLNNGSGVFSAPANYSAGGLATTAIDNADVDGDGDQDLVTANYSSGDISILLNNGSGVFSVLTTYSVGSEPYFIAAANLNGDTYKDLLVANAGADDTISVFLSNGTSTGTFAAKVDYPTHDGPTSVIAADVNGDGFRDIVAPGYDTNDVAVLLNSGTGTFSAAVGYGPTGINPWWAIAINVDNDGDLDLATVNYGDDTVSILENLGGGTFATTVNYSVGSKPFSIAASDVDNDGDQDLIVANETSEDISILLNDHFAPRQGTLIVKMVVINDNGGGRPPSDFFPMLSSVNPLFMTFLGNTSGTVIMLDPGAYSVTQAPPANYLLTIDANCSGTIASGQTIICVITNDDQMPAIASGGSGGGGGGSGIAVQSQSQPQTQTPAPTIALAPPVASQGRVLGDTDEDLTDIPAPASSVSMAPVVPAQLPRTGMPAGIAVSALLPLVALLRRREW
ncbi:MAG: VCBS repeat-containing protein [Patescibacteria group bacterium]|jgi:hypothetical protein